MVTKQQQLEWLAKKCKTWSGQDATYLCLSVAEVGQFAVVNAHVITRQEWQQERDKMSSKPEVDNSWYERGELPPVGCECEIKHKCWTGFQRITVVAITKEYAIVEDDSVVTREQHYYLRDMIFRPHRTKREKAIDAACGAIGKVDESGLLMLERLYDAGLLK